MKAIVRESPVQEGLVLKEVPEPVPGPGEVKIKTAYAGICGTDLHMYQGEMKDLPIPNIVGHEFSGKVVEVGEGVENITSGVRVTAEHTFSVCGRCDYCQKGDYHLCQERTAIGFEEPGSFAEYVIVGADYVHQLPESVSLQEGAVLEPLASAMHGIELIEPRPGQDCLVVGPGPMGLLITLCLKTYNCEVDIIGTEKDKSRLELAQEIGAGVVTDIKDSHYDIVCECSGSSGGIKSALKGVRKKGQCLQVGISEYDIEVGFSQMVYKEINLQGIFCHHWQNWEKALKLQSLGLLDVKPLITDVIEPEAWERGFKKLLNKNAVKVLINFQEV